MPRRNTLTYEPKPGAVGGLDNNQGNATGKGVDTAGANIEMQDVDLGKTGDAPGAGGADGGEGEKDREPSISISGSLTVYDQPRSGKPIEFHVSLFDFMTKDNNLAETAGVHMVARIRGEVKDTFNYIDANGDNNIDMVELKNVLAELGEVISHFDAMSVFNEIDTDGNGLISYKEFEQWYLRSAQVMRQDVRRLFKKFSICFASLVCVICLICLFSFRFPYFLLLLCTFVHYVCLLFFIFLVCLENVSISKRFFPPLCFCFVSILLQWSLLRRFNPRI